MQRITNEADEISLHYKIKHKKMEKQEIISGENLNPEQSLQIINNMINAAKNKLADDGFFFIFWGWLVAIAAMFHYTVLKMGFEWGYWVWIILMPLGGIISSIYGYKQGNNRKVKTHIDIYIGYLWGGFIIGMTITLGFMYWHGIKHTYFFLMILYGIATFISGGLLNFKPLIIGSLFAFLCAGISVFLSDADQLLIISLALLFSYIIPGHLLRSKYRSQNV